MSIETEITRISTNVSDTLSAVSEMGGEVPEGATSNDMAAGVRSIPVGAKIDDTTPSSTTVYSSQKIESVVSALNAANAAQDERLTTLEQAGGIVTVEPAQDDVPIVFFGGDLPQTKTDTVMPFKYVSKTKTVNGYAKAKAQGNSSMSYPKKNQTINMYADEALTESMKVDFKGWGVQKKHVYKANWIDLTHARNIVSAQLWGDVVKSRTNYADLPELLRTSPNQGAIDGFPALVYANGVYQGRYTINIPKDGWMANMDKTLDTHCILCGENYVSGCFRATANINGSDWSDELHDTVPDAIKTRWNEVISFVMNSTDEEFKANLGNYFYVDSLIDYLLFALASCGLDSMGKNQLYMTYDGQRWIASMYDMDSTWGLYWNGSSFVASDYARTSYEDYVSGREGNLLYIRLEQNFYEEIQARWAELKAGPLSYANIMTRFERFIGIVPPHIVKEDYASTTGGGSFTGIPSQSTNHIQQIRAFAIARQAWTDEYVAALTPEVTIPCTGITLDQTTLTFTAAGTQTLTATVTPSNTTDTVVWSSDASSIASVSNGIVKAKANGSATITATCGAYSATCTVSVSGINESTGDVIDYAVNALDGVTWYNDFDRNVSTGELTAKTGHYTTDKFSVQGPCLYTIPKSSVNLYPNLFVWDKDGTYIGCYGNFNLTFDLWLNPDHLYSFRCSSDSFDASNSSLTPVDNRATAVNKIEIDLASLSWNDESDGVSCTNFGLTATSQTDVLNAIHDISINSPWCFVQSGNNQMRYKNNDYLHLSILYWGGVTYLKIYNFKTASEAVAYFTENNTKLIINSGY